MKVSNTFEKYLPLFKEAEITEKFIENSQSISGKWSRQTIWTGKYYGMVRMFKIQSNKCYECNEGTKVIKKVTGLGAGKYKFIEL